MKKVMFCLAVAGMFAFAACNNGATEQTPATEPTPAECTEQPVAEENADATIENAAEENAENAAATETSTEEAK